VRRILRRKKYVYIWAKYSLEDKQDKELRKAFKEKLDGSTEPVMQNYQQLMLVKLLY
jgi:hypothetical protein